jgi:cell division protein FtsA
LTGGTSKMEGVIDLAEEIFHMPVRLGVPQNISGLTDIVRNPIYSTSVGLLQYGFTQHTSDVGKRSKRSTVSFVERMKNWIQSNF